MPRALSLRRSVELERGRGPDRNGSRHLRCTHLDAFEPLCGVPLVPTGSASQGADRRAREALARSRSRRGAGLPPVRTHINDLTPITSSTGCTVAAPISATSSIVNATPFHKALANRFVAIAE